MSWPWPEPPCGCGTKARCAECGTCLECYDHDCYDDRGVLTPDDALAYITDPVRAVGRARRAPVSKARARIAERRAAKVGPPPHVGPPPEPVAPADPVAPPGGGSPFAGLLDFLEREIKGDQA